MFTLVFLLTGKENVEAYQLGYKILVFAFALVMVSVYVAYRRVSKFNLTREGETIDRGSDKLTPTFWAYCVFAFLSTFGFVAFSIIGFHLKDKGVMPDSQITLMYSIAMIVDAVMAMVIGRIYDVIKKKRNNKKAGLLTFNGGKLRRLLLGVIAVRPPSQVHSSKPAAAAFHPRGSL